MPFTVNEADVGATPTLAVKGSAMRYLRKLITKDGIEGPLLDVEPEDARMPNVYRVISERISYSEAAIGNPRVTESREYRLEREEQVIIMTYREV